MYRKFLTGSILAVIMGISSSFAFACGGADSGKHIGSMLNINAENSTFTIRDMESNAPITFNASTDIMKQVKKANGQIMVNYEEDDDGSLVATSVAF